MKTLMGSVLAIAVGISVAQASVFDDAAFWYHASSPNAGGAFKVGDFTDNRYAADADHWLNQSTIEGVASRVQICEERVVHPFSCITNIERVIRLDQSVSGSSVTAGVLRMPNLFNVTNSEPMTVVLRLRWDGIAESVDAQNARAEVLSLGFDGASKNECGYCIAIDRSTRRFFVFDRKKYKSMIPGSDSDDYRVSPGEWVDVAFVFRKTESGGGRIDQYMMQEGISMPNGVWHNASVYIPDETMAVTATTNSPIRLGAVDQVANGPRSGKSASARAFAGSFSQVAIWTRSLTQGEIAEAFGGTALRFEYGVENGSSDEFAGTTRTVFASATNVWRDLPPTLTPETPNLTLDFDVASYEAGLPQIVRFVSTPQSAQGTLSLQLNGLPIASDFVAPGVGKMFYIQKDKLVVGKNTLTFTWSGVGILGIDALSCGGSWQLGYEDSSVDDFMPRNRYRRDYYLNPPATWKTRCNQVITREVDYWNNNIHFMVPPSYTNNKYRIEIPAWCGWSDAANGGTFVIYLNGVERSRQVLTSKITTLTVKLNPGELLGGENILTVYNEHPTNCTLDYDCFRLVALRPPTGLGGAVIIR